jgi:hypothetical protein
LFGPASIDRLQRAVADYSLLLSKGYADKSSLKLVGDRFSLTDRQRLAVMRSACSDQQAAHRKERQIQVSGLAGQPIVIDGYNLLITVEAAMSGGLIFKGRDGCFRDLASIHGTYRKVTETIPAVEMIGQFLQETGITEAHWLLDKPVSNSGRLKTLIGELAANSGWNWDVELLPSPDGALAKTELTAATGDSAVLDRCSRWVNLARAIIERKLPESHLVDLSRR